MLSRKNRIGYIEQMGTGIMRIKNATKLANVADPEFEFIDFFKVIFKRNEIDNQSVTQDDVKVASDRVAIEFR